MLRWAFRANFTNCSRLAKQEISFHDIAVEMARNEMKSVTHVHAQSVTNVPARCRRARNLAALSSYTRAGALPRCPVDQNCLLPPPVLAHVELSFIHETI
jgi:hypothetical protein